MAGVSFSMVRPQRLVEDDNENLVEENSSNLAQRLKQQQMATDTKVSRMLEKMDRPSLKCFLQIFFMIILTISVIIIAAKLWSLPSSQEGLQESIQIHQRILDVLTRRDYKSPEAVCPSKLYTHVGPKGRWDSCYYVHQSDGPDNAPPGYYGSGYGPDSGLDQQQYMTMEEGRTFCAKIHGHLLAIETKTEALYVQQLTSDSWLSASNAADGVNWLWMDVGEGGDDVPLNFSAWGTDEPKQEEGYRCAAQVLGVHWKSSKCDAKHPVTCEAPAIRNNEDSLPVFPDTVPPERYCPDNSTCYLFVNTRLRWERARDYCEQHGGYLARPDSPSENKKLKEYIYLHTNPRGMNSRRYSNPADSRVKWLGAQGTRLEMKWMSNGKLLSETYQDWRSEYGNGDEKEDLCLAYNITSRMEPHHWTAISCHRWLSFICEIPTGDTGEEEVAESVISNPYQITIVDERAECAFESNGHDYRGTLNVTSAGNKCLAWRAFHSHELVVDSLLNHNLEENYCRNPNNESAPWCIVGSKQHPRWEYCDVPACKTEDFTIENHLCGAGRPKYGLPSTCDGNGKRPCCSSAGYCGSDVSDCQCYACKDYRPLEPVHPLLGPSYRQAKNGKYYSVKRTPKTWEEARKVCQKDGGDLAGEDLFLLSTAEIHQLMSTRSVIGPSASGPYRISSSKTGYWIGLSVSFELSEEKEVIPWTWVSGDELNVTRLQSLFSKYRSRYSRLSSYIDLEAKNASATDASDGKFCAKLTSVMIARPNTVDDANCGTELAFFCEVSFEGEDNEETPPTPEPPLTVSSINSSFTLHFVQSQRSHEDAETFCADRFPGGKLVSLDSADKRTKTGDLAIKVVNGDRSSEARSSPHSGYSGSGPLSPSDSPAATALTYWWVGAGSRLTSSLTLVRGDNVSSGNVFIGGQPVCDDGWGPTDAKVVCRQLGFLNGTATFNSRFGAVPSNFAMDQVECLGHEEHLKLCPHSKIHDCGSSEGAGVVCYGKQSREQIAKRREAKVCQRATFTDDSVSRYNPPWSSMVQVNCRFSHWFICESDVERTISKFTVINGTRSD